MTGRLAFRLPLLFLLLLLVPGFRPGSAVAQTNLVASLPVEGIIRRPVHLFDLQGKTLRFTPGSDGSYALETLSSTDVVQGDLILENRNAGSFWPVRTWSLPLPFRFPFGGKSWDRVFVSNFGCVTFEKPENELYTQRDTWPSAGMCSVAAAIDSRSVVGLERMIAVLWANYHDDPRSTVIRARVDASDVTVTWSVRRSLFPAPVADANVFQLRLYPSGVIEMAYPSVTERDGIVGLFTGQPVNGARLDHVDVPWTSPHPSVDIEAVDIFDAGSLLQFVYTMKDVVPAAVPSGALMYRFFIDVAGFEEQVGVTTTNGSSAWQDMLPIAGAVGYQIRGRTVSIYLSKVLFGSRKQFTWSGDVVWLGMPGRFTQVSGRRTISLARASPGEVDLSAGGSRLVGNIFEVFHYPQATKNLTSLLQAVYRQFPARDDFALVFTAFRQDELHPGEGGSFSPLNVPIQGLGPSVANPISDDRIGSKQLQASTGGTWIGAPAFAETGVINGSTFRNYAKGVFWISHELTHRWGVNLRFRNPQAGQIEPLAFVHWPYNLHSPAFVPLGNRYIESTSAGSWIMGGSVWVQNADGTFTPESWPGPIPGGLSGLDLYMMGLLPPGEVPDTFLLQNVQNLGNNRFRATKVPVRISDIVAAEGARVPDSASSQKAFRLAFYLVHEPGRPVEPALLQRANGLAIAVADFFERAAGGRMKILHSRIQ